MRILSPGMLLILVAPMAAADTKVDFNRDIRPILSDKCYACHGPDEQKRRAELRLDTREGAFAEKTIVPHHPEKSLLIERITHANPRKRMPPAKSKLALSSKEIALLKQWIQQGAPWQEHWSLIPLKTTKIPKVRDLKWSQQPWDRFVLARLEREGLRPAARAEPGALARRISFDLTGLPLSVEELDAFEKAWAIRPEQALEALVDRKLASPHFGERRAQAWLDLARFADTYGYQSDVYRPMWPWRDWVIQAFNQNLSYDQFLTWQLAGDLLKNPTRDQILATAFNRLHRQTNEGGSIEEEWRTEYVADRVNTFGYAMLGLTVECARCHDHKFDPIRQKDYYQLFSFFNNIDESGLYSHFTRSMPNPTLLLPTPQQEKALTAARQRVADEEAKLAQLRKSREPAFQAWLKARPKTMTIPGLIGHFPLEKIQSGKVANHAKASQPGRASDNPQVIKAKIGNGVLLSGENNLSFSVGGNFTRNDPFSIALWMKTPDHKQRAVIFHRSRAWTDAGSRGYQLLLEDGKLSASLIHFWPGNAIRIRTRRGIPTGTWLHVSMAYTGSSSADGLSLFINGQRADCEVVRDHLFKNITGGGGTTLTFGQRFRDKGFKNGMVDEIQVYNRAITPLEAKQIVSGASVKLREQKDLSDLRELYLSAIDPEMQKQQVKLKQARQARSRAIDPLPEIMVMKEMPKKRPTYLLKRGAYDAPGEAVVPGAPSSVLTYPQDFPPNRLGLAQWLTDRRNPLTARVVVNRVWQSLFGRGLVRTPEDFGSQGQPPTHPKLLDWLALRLMDSGWDLKKLYRDIILSATYQQSSRATGDQYKRDPANRLLARGPKARLSAEMLRDNALSASGLLVRHIGGASVKPYQPAGLWKEKSGKTYRRDVGIGSHRRSLYTYWKRTSPPPSMITMDAARRNVCVVQRQSTSTPLQPLVLLNDPQYVEAARALAELSLSHGKPPLAIQYAFRTLTSRAPTARELAILTSLFQEQQQLFQQSPKDAKLLLAIGDAPANPAFNPIELAAFTVTVQALFNFDAVVMKR